MLQDEPVIELPDGPLFPEFNSFDRDAAAMKFHWRYVEAERFKAQVAPPDPTAFLRLTGF